MFLGGQVISMAGDGLAVLAIPLLVLRLTSSPVAAVLAALPGSAGYLAAGTVTLITVATAWLVALRHEEAGQTTMSARGR